MGMERWVGKTAVVTGASAGIGADIAVTLANAGMVVVAAARRMDKLKELTERVKGPGRILLVRCDIGKAEDVELMIDFAKKNAGGIDVLVNNAGYIATGTITDCNGQAASLEDITDCMNINVNGVISASRLAAADMTARKIRGHIININSVAGHKIITGGDEVANTSVYAATKHALAAITEIMRLEFSQTKNPIRITGICPGAVDTAMLHNLIGEIEIPMLKGQDIADTVAYVLSTPDNVNITELTIQPVGEMF